MTEIQLHSDWLKVARDKMAAVLAACGERPNNFFWSNPRPYSWAGALLGYSGRYATGRDLTADLLLLWLDHPAGDTARFYLADAIEGAGTLWDVNVEGLIWDGGRALESRDPQFPVPTARSTQAAPPR